MVNVRIFNEEFVSNEAKEAFLDYLELATTMYKDCELLGIKENDEGDILLTFDMGDSDVNVNNVMLLAGLGVPSLFNFNDGWLSYYLTDDTGEDFYFAGGIAEFEDDGDGCDCEDGMCEAEFNDIRKEFGLYVPANPVPSVYLN